MSKPKLPVEYKAPQYKLNITKKQAEEIKSLIPQFAKDIETKTKGIEDIGTAQYESAQQFYLAVEQVLTRHFNFSEDDLRKLETELYHIMTVTKYVEDRKLSVMTHHTMQMVGEIAMHRALDKLKKEGVDKLLPSGTVTKTGKISKAKKRLKHLN